MTQDRPLLAAYRGIVCDLDGVVYRGAEPVEHAVESLEAAREHVGIVFATNNASRPAAEVREQLRGLGVRDPQVVTSAHAGAQFIAAEFGPGATVLGVGGEGVVEALAAAGLRRVTDARSGPVAVLQGWAPQVRVADLAQAAIAVRAGARWVVTNTDRTLPTPDGPIPGNGTLVAAVQTATGAVPTVVGKPETPLYAAATARLGVPGELVLAIGDRLDTDIAGAARAGVASLWVLTGVDGFASLATAAVTPTYAAADLRTLHRPYPQVPESRDAAGWRVGGLLLRADPGQSEPVVGPAGDAVDANTLAAWGVRALCRVRDGGPGAGPDAGLARQVGVCLDELLERARRAQEGPPGRADSSVS